MTQTRLSVAYRDLLYLIRCAVRQEKPSFSWALQTPLASLLKLAKYHSIEALLYDTVKTLPLGADQDSLRAWQLEHDKAYRRYLLFMGERQAILADFEASDIWYCTLKGVILQEDYPKPYYRQMSDNDILFDKTRRNDVKKIMVTRGYEVGHFNYQYDDVYYKAPCYNFEMHVKASVAPEFEAYFADLNSRLIETSAYARQMSPQDFYFYLLSHELKHYQLGGTGLRSLIDLQFYLSHHALNLDVERMESELAELGVLQFEQQRRALVNGLFSDDEDAFMSILDSQDLAYYCQSGTYGTLEQSVENRLFQEGQSKGNILAFYITKSFKIERVVANYPILTKYRFLIPFYMVFRIMRGFFNPRNWQELAIVLKKVRQK